MKAYGNMSAAEKAINRDDLHAYKEYDGKNYAMIPGIQASKQINMNRLSASPQRTQSGSNANMKTTSLGSPKRNKETEEKLQENHERLKQHGAVHLTKDLANYE
jgi:hypothetical protein